MTSPSPSPTTPATTDTTTDATGSAEATPDPDRPTEPGPGALFDALAAEHAAIYGYGLVSAHVLPQTNELVSQAVAEHRDRRDATVDLMTERSIKVPLAAVGYQLPMPVDTPANAAKLAIRMESDCAVAWRAVLEQTTGGDTAEQDRAFAATALTQCAVMAARWRVVLGAWPVIEAFPGGTE
ncbi:MAG: DUF4439 domain-containing protein [Mycobacterium sp.]|nr:DUF4439 domain-containing protein [Mycobacterium sp.]